MKIDPKKYPVLAKVINLTTKVQANEGRYSWEYFVMVSQQNKMNRIFKMHNLSWEPKECVSSDEDGNCIEYSGDVVGSKKDVISFALSTGLVKSEKEIELRKLP